MGSGRLSNERVRARSGASTSDVASGPWIWSWAAPLLVVSLPLQGLVAALVRTKLGSPVVFRHDRPGLNEECFTLFKFRTMSNELDGDGNLLPDEERLGAFGQFLRSASLDELPELWNVVKGEMSLVGPRPLLTKYLPLYSLEQARRHEVRPGVTGWAQVNGRNSADWDEKLAMDVWYVDNVSFSLDMKILLKTVKAVFGRRGINTPRAMQRQWSSLDASRNPR